VKNMKATIVSLLECGSKIHVFEDFIYWTTSSVLKPQAISHDRQVRTGPNMMPCSYGLRLIATDARICSNIQIPIHYDIPSAERLGNASLKTDTTTVEG
jgi:hypothetical protein